MRSRTGQSANGRKQDAEKCRTGNPYNPTEKTPIMLKSLGIATMLAVAAAGMSRVTPAVTEVAQRPSRTAQVGRSYRRIGNGYRYPEQSSRQALRLHRRAQGGRGLVFTGAGYEPKP